HLTRSDADRINAAAVAPDGATLATADSRGKLRLWDFATGKETAVLDANNQSRFLKFSHDGRYLAASGIGPALELWDVTTRKPVRPEAAHRGAVGPLTFLDADRIVTAGGDGLLAAWAVKDGRLLASTRTHRESIDVLAVPRPGEILTSVVGGDLRRWR